MTDAGRGRFEERYPEIRGEVGGGGEISTSLALRVRGGTSEGERPLEPEETPGSGYRAPYRASS